MEIGVEFTIGRALASWLQFDVVGSNWVEGAGTEPICPGWTSRECELDGVIAGMEGGCEGLERSPTSLQDSLYRTASGKIPRGPCTDNAWWPEKLRPGGRKTNESSSAATVERARVQVRHRSVRDREGDRQARSSAFVAKHHQTTPKHEPC